MVSSLQFVQKDAKQEDKRLTNGQAMERLIKNEDFKIFIEELSNRRDIALHRYLTNEANESLRQVVLTLDEVMGIPGFFDKLMKIYLMEKNWKG